MKTDPARSHVPKQTLLPATEWTPPTADDVKAMLCICDLSQYQAGLYLGLAVQPATNRSGNTCRTVRRWLNGESTIPYAAWALLADRAGFGEIWREQ